MPREGSAGWSKSATLPATPQSFAGVTYAEMLARARELVPAIAARAAECEKLRRLPDETERDLHRTGLFRMVQPARVGGADLDVGILVDTCAAVARVCPRLRGTSAISPAITGCWATSRPRCRTRSGACRPTR